MIVPSSSSKFRDLTQDSIENQTISLHKLQQRQENQTRRGIKAARGTGGTKKAKAYCRSEGRELETETETEKSGRVFVTAKLR